jgi:hypothetical protein
MFPLQIKKGTEGTEQWSSLTLFFPEDPTPSRYQQNFIRDLKTRTELMECLQEIERRNVCEEEEEEVR